MASDPCAFGVEQEETRRKRARREDLELLQLAQDVRKAEIQNLHGIVQMMTTIRPDWKEEDEDFCKQAETAVKNVLAQPSVKAQGDPLTIPQVAREIGHKRLTCDRLRRAETLAVKRYNTLHRTKYQPPNRLETVDDHDVFVDVYAEADRPMLVGVLTDLRDRTDSDSDSD